MFGIGLIELVVDVIDSPRHPRPGQGHVVTPVKHTEGLQMSVFACWLDRTQQGIISQVDMDGNVVCKQCIW